MAIHRLTPRELEKILASRPERSKLYSDGGGLNLQIGPGGAAQSWIFRFSRKPFGKPGETHMGLGPLHTVSIDEAREQARVCRQQLLKGTDPMEARKAGREKKRREESKDVTFGFCADDFLTFKKKQERRPNTIELMERMIRLYLNPALENIIVADIDHHHLHQILEPIWYTKTGTADKVREYAAAILDRAKARGLRGGDNPADLEGPLGVLLGPLPDTSKPFVSLPYCEVPAFMAKLRGYVICNPQKFPELAQIRDSVHAKLIEFIILTAVRADQTKGMKWKEIDWDNKVWNCPWQRTKTGSRTHKDHEVHLSEPALAILRYMKAMQKNQKITTDYVFTGNRSDRVGMIVEYRSTKMLFTKVLRPAHNEQAGLDIKFTVHGFRDSFGSWSDDNNFQREAKQKCLDHAVGSHIEQLYSRGAKRWKERVRLLEAWGAFCGGIEASAEVIPMRRRK
jgi:integrase